ncbi:MAG: DUF2953 domain-containing protein [Candidatus Cohnella colombiensis]|uniref:DUF2953 domain-containing protein n=1 Tax=Candidatus Cohnella colombiensis TaxID=3121368 RepID=A0AA95EZ98_9BACL|nr:MAG: DUF2953 domain-containing protein [Cohnella sp.]
MAFWLWICVAMIVIVVTLVLLSRIRFRIRYSRSGQEDKLVLIIQALYGLIKYELVIPAIILRGWSLVYREKKAYGMDMGLEQKPKQEQKNKRKISVQTIRRYRKAYKTVRSTTRNLQRWALQTLKKLECTRWRLDFRVGTGDAQSTAITTGLLWAVAGCAAGAVGQLLRLNCAPDNRIEPNYRMQEFTMIWEADFQMKLLTVVVSGIKLVTKIRLPYRKAIHTWKALLRPPGEL